jgi:hypothetical protein
MIRVGGMSSLRARMVWEVLRSACPAAEPTTAGAGVRGETTTVDWSVGNRADSAAIKNEEPKIFQKWESTSSLSPEAP